MITDSSVRMVRVRLRNRLAMTNPVLVMAVSRWPPQAAACSSSWPFSRCSVRRANSAAFGSCVTITMVLPCSRLSTCSRPEDLVGGLAVEVAGGLIAHQQLRVRHQRARDRDALLLAAGELARLVLGAVGETHHLQRDGDVLLALRGGQLGQQQRQLDVAFGGEHRHQVVELEHEADVVGAPVGELAAGELVDAAAADAGSRRRSG